MKTYSKFDQFYQTKNMWSLSIKPWYYKYSIRYIHQPIVISGQDLEAEGEGCQDII